MDALICECIDVDVSTCTSAESRTYIEQKENASEFA